MKVFGDWLVNLGDSVLVRDFVDAREHKNALGLIVGRDFGNSIAIKFATVDEFEKKFEVRGVVLVELNGTFGGFLPIVSQCSAPCVQSVTLTLIPLVNMFRKYSDSMQSTAL